MVVERETAIVGFQGALSDSRQICQASAHCPTSHHRGFSPEKRGCGKRPRFLKRAQKSRTASPNHRFVIALHSPEEVFETGLVGCPPEKSAAKCIGAIEHATFSGPPLIGKVAELRLFRAIFKAIRTDFSALQTAWRRGRDSNPRYGFGNPAIALAQDRFVCCGMMGDSLPGGCGPRIYDPALSDTYLSLGKRTSLHGDSAYLYTSRRPAPRP